MERDWEADPSALFERRLGLSAEEQKISTKKRTCPDIWQMSNGDIAVIGRDLTAAYRSSLPEGVSLAEDERLVIIPGIMLSTAKRDIPDA
ncbi:hypothetical protein [Streptomyces johnsoniae]|uniref:Uncharacterized protein n=1 Tax=Streptomyces johnsoniae TaxID=3075532 RepID=A0ABU2RYM5_9ACTN|nr:hypothetical protein [Streptomyces sp. DSM 41886]MDT0441852.1 hypothetical protein [Streptomyces sp. DSM 41886]